jgi:hypothetical protein
MLSGMRRVFLSKGRQNWPNFFLARHLVVVYVFGDPGEHDSLIEQMPDICVK